jgi:hypothetical protein
MPRSAAKTPRRGLRGSIGKLDDTRSVHTKQSGINSLPGMTAYCSYSVMSESLRPVHVWVEWMKTAYSDPPIVPDP